jgi:hypothetical protein
MKKLLIAAIAIIVLASCNTKPPVVTYEVAGKFEIKEEPGRTITLRDTTYYFWSLRDSTGEVKCYIAIKRDKNFKELHDR